MASKFEVGGSFEAVRERFVDMWEGRFGYGKKAALASLIKASRECEVFGPPFAEALDGHQKVVVQGVLNGLGDRVKAFEGAQYALDPARKPDMNPSPAPTPSSSDACAQGRAISDVRLSSLREEEFFIPEEGLEVFFGLPPGIILSSRPRYGLFRIPDYERASLAIKSMAAVGLSSDTIRAALAADQITRGPYTWGIPDIERVVKQP